MNKLKTVLCLLTLLCSWSVLVAQKKQGACLFDEIRNAELEKDPSLKEQYERTDVLLRYKPEERAGQVRPAKNASSANFVIPVVFYIVHNGGPENITDQQVNSQLDVMNTAFASHGIEFCLATMDGSTPLSGSPTPGIIRVQSPLTDHLQSQEQQLKALSTLNGQRFLRVWVVKDINNGSGIAGYARFPGGNPSMDGIVVKYNTFGEASTCSCVLLPNYDKGYVMIHELGHWLGLYHTFHGGCSGASPSNCATAGDQLCDTPPVAAPNFGCPSSGSINSCPGTPADLLNNYMDYTNDLCKNAFTTDQETRMLNAISNFRQTLVSMPNLQHTGINCVANILFADFTVSNFNPCFGETVTFTATPVTGATYGWDFGDQATGTGAAVTHTYGVSTPQSRDVTLTVTNNGQSVSATEKLFFTDCTIKNCRQGNWYFGTEAGLDFRSGSPQAVFNSNMGTIEGSITESLPNCSLVYYSNGVNVWDHQHNNLNPGQPLTGHMSTSQSALSIPDPGGSDDYFLFTLPSLNSGAGALPWSFTRVNVTLNAGGTAVNNVALSNINTPIARPTGVNQLSEAQTAIEKCNGEYWVLVKNRASFGVILVYEFNTSGISHIANYPSAVSGTGATRMVFSPDGSQLAVTSLGGVSFSLFDFDRSTGVLSNERIYPIGTPVWGICFSPNSRLLYVSEGSPVGRLYQYDLHSANFTASKVHIGDAVHFENNIHQGPDDKLYVSVFGQQFISVINYPDVRASQSSPNACGFNPNGPSVENPSISQNIPACRLNLPDYITAQSAAVIPLEITYSMVNCTTVVFHAPDCNGPYLWDFDDPASSSNTATTASATHTFSHTGVYTVTLTAGSNTRTLKISIGLDAAIAGSDMICPSISSLGSSTCTSIPGAQYVWSVSSGGSLQSLNGMEAMDVLWTTLPGTVSVQITDPFTLCTTTETFNVTQNCNPPDLFMKDTPSDFGVEPNPNNGPMWVSEDIWVRNSQDPPPHINQHQHQNPEYSATVPNYIYVKIRNRGQTASNGMEELKLYWAKASTGLSWPNPWQGGFHFGVPPLMPQGDVVGTQTIPVVQANDFVILEFPWSPRDPDEYASVFGMDKAHFCLLARIETNGTAPFGMSSPETADLYQNVKGNNNIAWKNVTVVDLVSNFTGSGNVAVGNPAREASTINLQFGVKEASGLDFLEHGTVRIRMDKEMRELIRKSNPELKGLEWENEKTLLVTSPRATLNNIKLGAQEHHVLQFDFQWQEKNEAKKGKEYRFSLMQYQQDKKGQKTMLGGETFTIEKKKVRKRRFWLWDWLFRLFERKKN